jgi:hypothetical protein
MVRSLGLACACAASILVPLVLPTNAAHASDADEVFAPSAIFSVPGNPLQSFDISYVDAKTHRYLLADRSNKAIDVGDTLTNSYVTQLIPTLPFAGVVASPANASGPNGVILITGVLAKRSPTCSVACGPTFGNGQPVSLVWATDSPTPATSGTSSIKVLDLASGATVKVINTLGVRRSDELCFVTLPSGDPDPKNPYVLVANDDPLDNFITFWRWDNFASAGRISLKGNDPLANPYNTAAGGTKNAANGIEQCKFNPRNQSFYLSVPATTGSTTDGFVLKISLPVMKTPTSPVTTPAKVVYAYEILPGTGCVGPAGLSIGPSFNATNTNGEIALGCGATGGSSLIIDDFGETVFPVPLPAGTDETWYDPASNHFFFAQSGTGPASGWLGVVDAGGYPPLSFIQEDGDTGAGGLPTQDPTAIAATGSHSVAVFPGTCGSSPRLSRVYVPTRSNLTTPNNSPTFCSSHGGSDGAGCIAVFTASAATCTSTGHK